MTANETKKGLARNVLWIILTVMCSLLIGMQLGCSLTFESATSAIALDDERIKSILLRPRAFENPRTDSSAEIIFDLARKESLGFFDEPGISTSEWKERQTWARNASFHRYPDSPKRFWDKPGVWYLNSYDPIFNCPFAKRIGGIGDGPKWTCDPHRLKQVVARRQQQRQQKQSSSESFLTQPQKSDCLIYSVGSNGNYQWEDGMVREIGTICEIHVFDYSKNYTRVRNKERNIHFHQWGLHGNSKTEKKNFYTFPQILEKLGHNDRTIDIFKIDCEGCEWGSYQDWIDYDVRQVLIETHKLPSNKTLGLHFFDSFANNNLIMYSKEPNAWGGGMSVEFSYIKLHPNFLHPTE